MNIIKIIKCFIPHGIILLRGRYIRRKQDKLVFEIHKKEKEIKKYFLNLNEDEQDSEVLEIINFLRKNSFSVFPYDFIKKYHAEEIGVFYDEIFQLKYVLYNNKRLYFPKHFSYEKIRGYYNSILIEQDADSPHRYDAENFIVQDGDIIADIGVAEGIWALTYAEKAKKIYLFECEEYWIEALQKTFEPWKEKVILVNKYVSDVTDEKKITLDNFLCGDKIDFIKTDIEGAEIQFLRGAKKILTDNNVKLLLCTYHQQNDAVDIKDFLLESGFITEYSKGYMLFIFDKNIRPPYLRRGLIRARKKL